MAPQYRTFTNQAEMNLDCPQGYYFAVLNKKSAE